MFHQRIARCTGGALRSGFVRVPRSVLSSASPVVVRPLSLAEPAVASDESRAAKTWTDSLDTFPRRHIGPTNTDQKNMLKALGAEDMEDLLKVTIPKELRFEGTVENDGLSEHELLAEMMELASKNKVFKTYLGMGYYNCHLPIAIKRNVLENPGWYTPYTPYQAEISQGRLESLFNYQTMVSDLTGLDVANASLLDEPTAAAEAMTMSFATTGSRKKQRTDFIVDVNCNPATLDLLASRASFNGINLKILNFAKTDLSKEITEDTAGVLFQYPNTYGEASKPQAAIDQAKAVGAKVVCATDLLALTILTPPGEFGADICIGSAQRFGVPMGFGGPHAAFMSCCMDDVRKMPGRIVGRTVDSQGNPAYRLSLQTREQQIKRDKAVSNICTAQALLANIAAIYGVYHGPRGLKDIAARVHGMTVLLKNLISESKHEVPSSVFFDTITVNLADGTTADQILADALEQGINLRKVDDSTVGIALDETVCLEDVVTLANLFGNTELTADDIMDESEPPSVIASSELARTSSFMTHEVFNSYHSETELMRYLKHLENKDLSLVHNMIPLGSCTMKLNSATEMQGVTMPGFANIHPFVPPNQAQGYHEMFEELTEILCDVTGYDGMSLQPNSGAQGELAGLLAIRAYHISRNDEQRKICLIPKSAHGTNPASAIMAGMTVVNVNMTDGGLIDMDHFKELCEKHSNELSAVMITYPSTYGVFDEGLKELCDMVHDHGGQVYLDGANMNANGYLLKPGKVGADVSHLNLHKTFCIPHGGGGPGMGPIGVKSQLIPFLPSHVFGKVDDAGMDSGYSVSGAPYGSSLISTISWAYCKMMGGEGLKKASEVSVLSANYMMERLKAHYPVSFTGTHDKVAHEFIIDLTPFKKTAGIEAIDIAKRLQDYGFHAPTMSWPVNGVLMIEPTESESKDTLDSFCDAMIEIRQEIAEIEKGEASKDNNVLVNSPHTMAMVMDDSWDQPYSRKKAAFPENLSGLSKFWPTVGRVNDSYGDKAKDFRL